MNDMERQYREWSAEDEALAKSRFWCAVWALHVAIQWAVIFVLAYALLRR